VLTRDLTQRRRAQNRAAQRAFRERKEKHARDLEAKLSELTDNYKSLEASHSELMTAYEKLQKTLELLTSDDGDRGPTSGETMRKLLVLLHGDIKLKTSSTPPVKTEDNTGPKDEDGTT
jgi:AP-1-like transcription factor